MRKLDKVSARLSSSPNIAGQLPKILYNLQFSCVMAMGTFFGSQNVLNLVYFWVFQKHTVFDPSHHITMEVPLLGITPVNII